MATVKEMMMQDAVANAGTAYMMSAGDTFEGTITNTAGDTEDWIGIEMEAGTKYTISVEGTLAESGGTMDDGAMDTILTLFDSKGGMINMNDDTKDGLNSELEFTAPVSGTYYISVSTYRSNPNLDNSGMYTVSVTGVMVDPTAGEKKTGTERVDADDTTDPVTLYASGNDKLKGGDVNDEISGLSGDDTLYGMGGDDILDGGDDNDLLVGGPGADTLKGGEGQDTIDYSSSPDGVTIHLGDGTARGGDAEGDTIVDRGNADRVEHVRGSMYNDMLTGNSRDNSLWGLDGDDDLDGGDGDDTLEGGYGADLLIGGDDSDTASYAGSMMGVMVRLHSGQSMGGDAEGDMWTMADEAVKYTDSDEENAEVSVYDIENLVGSANADILAGDLRDNVIMGGGGDDKIYGGPSPADVDKGDDDMGLGGLTNADTLHGDGGNDMLFGGVGADTLRGGAGDDVLNGGAGNDTFWGGHGSDMIYADAADRIIHGNQPDNFTADGMAAPATPADESEEMEGDVDTLSYARGEEGIARTLGSDGTGAADVTDGSNVLIMGIENIIGTQGDDTLTGDAGDNIIEGHEGGDALDGGANPADGMGDTLSYEHSDDWVRVTLNNTGAATTSRGHASGDTASNFENVMGSAFDDDLTGNDATNRLWGLGGDDTIEGGAGNDTIEGGAGADDLDGGYADGDTATDGNQLNSEANTLSYAMSDAGVTVNLMTASASGGHAAGDTIATYEELRPTDDDDGNEVDVATFANITGSKYDDRLTGDHQDNNLTGGAGDDTLRGGASQRGDGDNALNLRGDVLVGGPGADVLDGGEDMNEKDDMVPDTSDGAAEGAMVAASVDWAVYKHAMEGISVDLSTNRGTGGEAMGDTLMNIELVWGSEHADTFIAGSGPDTIEGDGGSDTVSYEASDLGVTVNLGEATQHRTVAVTGDGTDASPYVFAPDADPGAVPRPTTGVPRLDANGEVFDEDNVEDEDDNPNVNGAAGDRLGSIENLTGSNHDDDLTGNANPNVFKGLDGDDELDGVAGNDTLEGGAGDDTLEGGAGADTLMGGAGDDNLNGGTEDDKLVGGAGNDDLSGGGGANTFVFSTEDAGDSDAILDWDTGTGNMIDLTAFELTADQVIEAITLRGTGTDAYVVINLEEYGGGRITIDDISDLDELDTETDGAEGDTADAIDTLNTDIFIL